MPACQHERTWDSQEARRSQAPHSLPGIEAKGRTRNGDDPNDAGTLRRHLDRAVTTSLRRLGTDTIDLYQLHAWDPLTPAEETLSFLDSAVRTGKIRYAGLSNFTGWQLQLAVSTAQAGGYQAPVTLQAQCSLATRETEWEMIPAARHNGLGLLVWSPLASGFLTGKYARSEERPADRNLSNGLRHQAA
jgi:aryl-alcohol dehydrogenase (NADP+)